MILVLTEGLQQHKIPKVNYQFRNPPKINIPRQARWTAVFRVDSKTEIWFLDLRNALPYFFYPVLCRLVNDVPTPRYEVPLTEEKLKIDERLVKSWGDKFFWSGESETFVVQLMNTYEYSERIEIEQMFLSDESFVVTKMLTQPELLLLPNSEFKEVFPEMHPDRSRL